MDDKLRDLAAKLAALILDRYEGEPGHYEEVTTAQAIERLLEKAVPLRFCDYCGTDEHMTDSPAGDLCRKRLDAVQ